MRLDIFIQIVSKKDLVNKDTYSFKPVSNGAIWLKCQALF